MALSSRTRVAKNLMDPAATYSENLSEFFDVGSRTAKCLNLLCPRGHEAGVLGLVNVEALSDVFQLSKEVGSFLGALHRRLVIGHVKASYSNMCSALDIGV